MFIGMVCLIFSSCILSNFVLCGRLQIQVGSGMSKLTKWNLLHWKWEVATLDHSADLDSGSLFQFLVKHPGRKGVSGVDGLSQL